MGKIRIAFLAYNLGQGGAERQLFYIVKTLSEQGHHADIFTFYQGGYWEVPLRSLGIRVVCINGRSKVARLIKFMNFINLGNYHYIHSQQFCTNLYAVAASILGKVDCIGSIRSDVIYDIRSTGIMGWFSLILPPRVVANSYQGVENTRKYFRNPKNTFFLPNAVDTDLFSPGTTKNETNYFKVITVGAIWKPKRVDRVIKIAEILKQRTNRKIIFEIIGDGDQMKDMIAMARSKKLLNSVVFFKGRSSDIASDYRDADALLLTSDYEGTPNVVLEAMSSGLPVIASRVGDVPRIIEDGKTGFSFECENVQEMADAIEALSKDRELCSSLGQQARKFIIDNYSLSRLSDRLKELYLPIEANL